MWIAFLLVVCGALGECVLGWSVQLILRKCCLRWLANQSSKKEAASTTATTTTSHVIRLFGRINIRSLGSIDDAVVQ